jgi:hypothetical protein
VAEVGLHQGNRKIALQAFVANSVLSIGRKNLLGIARSLDSHQKLEVIQIGIDRFITSPEEHSINAGRCCVTTDAAS